MKMNLDGLHDLLGNEAVTEAVALLVLEVEGFHEMRPKILKMKSCFYLLLFIRIKKSRELESRAEGP